MELTAQGIKAAATTTTATTGAATAPRTGVIASSKPWRCRSCAALLGIVSGGEIHVKYKDEEHWILGTCRRACRRCRTMNVLTVGEAPKRAA